MGKNRHHYPQGTSSGGVGRKREEDLKENKPKSGEKEKKTNGYYTTFIKTRYEEGRKSD